MASGFYKRRIWDVWPGILLTMIFWVIGAAIFAYYLSTFANYAATYAGLASVMVVLVFLYMVGVIFMLGAEVNAALMKYKVRQIIRRNISGNSARREQVLEEPDKPHGYLTAFFLPPEALKGRCCLRFSRACAHQHPKSVGGGDRRVAAGPAIVAAAGEWRLR